MTEIRTELLKSVFDIAVGSLDFGSGFLDNDQVDDLREIAVLLGVDPVDATPGEHRARYCTGHDWQQHGQPYRNGNIAWKCAVCRSFVYGPEKPS